MIASHGTRILPTVLLAGAPKCGTTLLFELLTRHEEILGTSPKEPNFLSSCQDREYPVVRRAPTYQDAGIDGYSVHFDTPRSRTYRHYVDGSPVYIYQTNPLVVVEKYADIWRPKVVFLLRRPEDRVASIFRHARDFAAAIPKDANYLDFVESLLSPHDGKLALSHRHVLRRAILHSCYADYIQRWVDLVGLDRCHVMALENLVARPGHELRALSQFLGVEIRPEGRQNGLSLVNQSRRVRWRRLHSIARAIPPMGDGKAVAALKRRYYRLNFSAMDPDEFSLPPDVARRLHSRFMDANSRLERLVDTGITARWQAP